MAAVWASTQPGQRTTTDVSGWRPRWPGRQAACIGFRERARTDGTDLVIGRSGVPPGVATAVATTADVDTISRARLASHPTHSDTLSLRHQSCGPETRPSASLLPPPRLPPNRPPASGSVSGGQGGGYDRSSMPPSGTSPPTPPQFVPEQAFKARDETFGDAVLAGRGPATPSGGHNRPIRPLRLIRMKT